MSGSADFFKHVENRRTYYGLKAESPISDDKIVEIVKNAVKHTPSSFNMQASRAVVFFGENHHKVWDTVKESFLEGMPEDQREGQSARFPGFKAGYASVAIFEDQTVVETMQKNMPAIAQSFPTWSEDASAMLQYVIWTALEAEGFGANLQHYFSYSPAIPTAVQKAFNVPESWKCTAIMPFGVPAGPPGNPAHPKTFDKIDERVMVIR